MSVPHGKWRIETQAIHCGEEEKYGGAAVTPIFQSSTFVFDGDTSKGYDAVKYVRCNNSPSHTVWNIVKHPCPCYTSPGQCMQAWCHDHIAVHTVVNIEPIDLLL